MTRRKRVGAVCAGTDCTSPPRRIHRAQYCTKCWNRKGRPQQECTVCGVEFAADVMLGRRCRPCVSQAAHGKRIVETYGLSAEMYAELLEEQSGRCFICHRKPGAKRLAVDHDHATGAVRGLLCRGCNRDVLGHLREDPTAFYRALEYLDHPPAKRVWPGRDVTPERGER